jgi:hypothetical protein
MPNAGKPGEEDLYDVGTSDSDRIWGEFEGEPPRKKRPGFLRETPGGRPKFDLGKSVKGPP